MVIDQLHRSHGKTAGVTVLSCLDAHVTYTMKLQDQLMIFQFLRDPWSELIVSHFSFLENIVSIHAYTHA